MPSYRRRFRKFGGKFRRWGRRLRRSTGRIRKARLYRRRHLSVVPPGIFPSKVIRKLRYVDQVDINPGTAGASAFYAFRANSIYDPDLTGTGHQPMGRDVLAGVFSNYVVIGSKITVRFFNDTNSNTVSLCGIIGTTETSSLTGLTPDQLIETKQGPWTTLSGTIANGHSISRPLRIAFTPKKAFNIVNVKDNLPSIGAGVGTNPTDQYYYDIWAAHKTTDVASIKAQVVIDYVVLFYNPFMPTMS